MIAAIDGGGTDWRAGWRRRLAGERELLRERAAECGRRPIKGGKSGGRKLVKEAGRSLSRTEMVTLRANFLGLMPSAGEGRKLGAGVLEKWLGRIWRRVNRRR
jgi:hypothetical protein